MEVLLGNSGVATDSPVPSWLLLHVSRGRWESRLLWSGMPCFASPSLCCSCSSGMGCGMDHLSESLWLALAKSARCCARPSLMGVFWMKGLSGIFGLGGLPPPMACKFDSNTITYKML